MFMPIMFVVIWQMLLPFVCGRCLTTYTTIGLLLLHTVLTNVFVNLYRRYLFGWCYCHIYDSGRCCCHYCLVFWLVLMPFHWKENGEIPCYTQTWSLLTKNYEKNLHKIDYCFPTCSRNMHLSDEITISKSWLQEHNNEMYVLHRILQ